MEKMDEKDFFDELDRLGLTPKEAARILSEINFLLIKAKQLPQYEETTPQKVTNLLINFGFRPKLIGFSYLRRAIIYCVENGTDVSISKTIYPLIAQEFNSTYHRVERAIKTAIETAFNFYNPNLINIMGASIDPFKERPTNSEFIFLIADKIRNNLL